MGNDTEGSNFFSPWARNFFPNRGFFLGQKPLLYLRPEVKEVLPWRKYCTAAT